MNKLRSDKYERYFCVPYLMGPNSLRLLDELLDMCPLDLTPDNKILDLGCGSGLTSLYLTAETGATVYAADLWKQESENRKRIEEWGAQKRIIPISGDVNDLKFEPGSLDAIVSIDSYHYFGGREGFFAEKILPLVKPGGSVLICVPGLKKQYEGRADAYLRSWLGDECLLFRSADEWRKIIGSSPDIVESKVWDLFGFYIPWQEWFNTSHDYALRDKMFFDRIIRPFTCFVGIMVRKRDLNKRYW